MSNFELAPLTYNGQIVLTSKQLANSYGCKRQRINENFRNHHEDFIEGIDYFFVEGEELANFKAQNPQGGYKPNVRGRGNYPTRRNSNSPTLFAFADSVNALYLWTKSGVLKHSHFINTPKAKEVFKMLSQSYFVNAAQTANTFSDEPAPNDLEKVRLLIKLAEMTDDKNLRDRLIKSAAQFLLAENIDGAADNLF